MDIGVLMIERHYSHLQEIQAIEELPEVNTRKLIDISIARRLITILVRKGLNEHYGWLRVLWFDGDTSITLSNADNLELSRPRN